MSKKNLIKWIFGVIFLILIGFIWISYINSAGRHIKIAERYEAMGDYQNAYRHFLKASRKNPEANIGCAINIQRLKKTEDPTLKDLPAEERRYRYEKICDKAKEHFDLAVEKSKKSEMLTKIERIYQSNGFYDRSLFSIGNIDGLTLFFEGLDCGDKMELSVRNDTGRFYCIIIPVGAILVTEEERTDQRMLNNKTVYIFMRPGAVLKETVGVVCIQPDRMPPASNIQYASFQRPNDFYGEKIDEFYNIHSVLAAAGEMHEQETVQQAINIISGWGVRELRDQLAKPFLEKFGYDESLSTPEKRQIRQVIYQEIEPQIQRNIISIQNLLQASQEYDSKHQDSYNRMQRRAMENWEQYLARLR